MLLIWAKSKLLMRLGNWFWQEGEMEEVNRQLNLIGAYPRRGLPRAFQTAAAKSSAEASSAGRLLAGSGRFTQAHG